MRETRVPTFLLLVPLLGLGVFLAHCCRMDRAATARYDLIDQATGHVLHSEALYADEATERNERLAGTGRRWVLFGDAAPAARPAAPPPPPASRPSVARPSHAPE